MKRTLLAALVVAVSTSLLTSPSMAATGAADGNGPVNRSVASGAPAGTSAPTMTAEAFAQRLRDKMPYISKQPTLVGNDVVWTVDVSPMRLTAKKGVSLLDRVGGSLSVSKPGIHVGEQDGNLLTKTVAPRLITKNGAQVFRVTLPKAVADDLRKLSPRELRRRVGVDMWNDKDTNAATPGYDRRQITSTLLPPGIAAYLASRRYAVNPAGHHRSDTRALHRAQFKKAQSNTMGTIVVYNGSPFNLNVAGSAVQCVVPWSNNNWPPGPFTLQPNASLEFYNVSIIAGNPIWYNSQQSQVDQKATSPWKSMGELALAGLSKGALVANITGNFSKGLKTVFTSMTVDLVLKGVIGAIAGSNECGNAGSAGTIAWTNASLGATQTAGNVSYWVPSFGRTAPMVGVQPTSIPTVAPGSPLTGYNATSANGLAVSPAVLQRELGMGGTVTLATLNSAQQNGNYHGFWCNFSNQQIGNPNSAQPTWQYGSTSLGGGTTASWGPCNATSVNTDADYNAEMYMYSAPGKDLENEGVTVLIGYSTTAFATAGPSPALPATTAASAAACVGTTAPCAYVVPASGSTPPILGCTPGTWNMLTPWNGTASMNLSSPPSAYNATSELTMQVGFTGVTASGSPVTMFAPSSLGGSVTSSFSPSAVNEWLLSPTNLAAVQAALGGPGGYVQNWMCVMTAESSIPSGIPTSSTAMNLGWYGVPVVVPIANPAGNAVSPPS